MSKEQTFLMKPKVDFCFKELMEDEEVRRGFISALLDVRPEDIRSTELLPTHLRKEHEEDKQGILDVRAFVRTQTKGKDGTFKEESQEEVSQMDLEIQLASFPLWPERSIFYLAKMYAGGIQKGQSYEVLPKCIHVGILDFLLFEEDEEYYSRFHLWEDTRRRMYSDKLELHILELPKLAKGEYPQTELLKWASFFRAEKKEEFEMAAEGSSYIERAYERLTEISADDLKRLEYEAREKAIRDHMYLMNYNLKKGLEEGRKEGLEEGRKKGLAEGRKEGLKEGRKEGLEQGIKALIKFCSESSCTKDTTCSRLMESFSISEEEAEEYLKIYWQAKS